MNNTDQGCYPGDLISLDIVGPMHHCSAGGHIYLLTVMDS
jgi:hypothetical protein